MFALNRCMPCQTTAFSLRPAVRPHQKPHRPHTRRNPRGRQLVLRAEIFPDAAPAWTLDQIAGLVVGFFLLGSYFAAGSVDKFIAKAQRRELGLCEECGGVYDPETCTRSGCPSRKAAGQ